MTNKMTSDFSAKPETQAFFTAIDAYVTALDGVQRERKAQVSYGVKRKFLWLWAYEKTADGTLYLSVTLDREVHEDGIHATTQTSANRWNHSVEVRSARTAESAWLRRLIDAGHEFAQG